MAKPNTSEFFNPGFITTVMDGGAGSSGKGKVGSFLGLNADNWQFAVNAFHPQAGHWVVMEDGRRFFYQTLNSVAGDHHRFEKMYLGPGAVIELPALLREMDETGLPAHKLGISPVAMILDEELDQGFERGAAGFDGAPASDDCYGTAKFGSTAHGVGSANARKLLRRPSVRLARDVEDLRGMLCDVPGEVMARLNAGQAGLMELAQGFQLSLHHADFYPYVTSRNVTVAQGFSDMLLPTRFAGQVVINFRTYPIRINSNKYLALDDGRHLTWAEVQAGVPHEVLEGDSGPGYPDQGETTWAAVTESSGSPEPISEVTSVTKLPRRVFTFSADNVREAVRHNDTGRHVSLSVNFANYVDHAVTGVRDAEDLTEKWWDWARRHMPPEYYNTLRLIGTGARTEDTVILP